MAFNYLNLDKETRKLMLEEIEFDISNDKLYLSKRFNENGIRLYSDLLKQVVLEGNEQSLAMALRKNNCFKTHEERKTKTGVTLAKVPETAPETLAEGEFNRFYIRGLCLRVINDGGILEVYRAQESGKPRQTSEDLLGSTVDPQKTLDDLRENIGIDTILGLPPGPNSGLSVKIV